MPQSHTCVNCFHWNPNEPRITSHFGDCHRFPPTIPVEGELIHVKHPRTAPEDSCYEWRSDHNQN